MTFVITYPTEDACPDIAWLDKRLQDVQERMPYLSLRLGKEGEPHDVNGWYWQEASAWTISDLYRAVHIDYAEERASIAALYEDAAADKIAQHLVLVRERRRMSLDHVWRTEPLWQFTRYTLTGSARIYLTFSVNHIMTDGVGMRNLFEACMRPRFDNPQEGPFGECLQPIEHIAPAPPVEAENKSNVKATDNGPAAITSSPSPPDWPSMLYPFTKPPGSYPEALRVVRLASETVLALKQLGRTGHGVSTLTPPLYIAWTLAIQWAVRAHASLEIRHLYDPGLPHFASATLMSNRDVKLGDSPVWGFGTQVLVYHLRIRPGDDFWDVVKTYAASLRHAHAKALARQIKQSTLDLALAASSVARTPENILANLMGPTPYSLPTGFSNLTYVPLPPGAEDMLFSQDPNPLLPGPCLNTAIGHEGGTCLVPGWRDGLLFTHEMLRNAERMLHQILRRVIHGTSSIDELLSP